MFFKRKKISMAKLKVVDALNMLSKKDLVVLTRFLEEAFPDGTLTSRELLEKARPRNSPIHHLFEWNDSIAAEKYRLKQAGKLVSCLIVEVEGKSIREYCQPIYVGSTKRYVKLDNAREDEDLWSQVLAHALNDAKRWNARYDRYKELKPISKAIVEVDKKLSRRKS